MNIKDAERLVQLLIESIDENLGLISGYSDHGKRISKPMIKIVLNFKENYQIEIEQDVFVGRFIYVNDSGEIVEYTTKFN